MSYKEKWEIVDHGTGRVSLLIGDFHFFNGQDESVEWHKRFWTHILDAHNAAIEKEQARCYNDGWTAGLAVVKRTQLETA